MNEYIEFEAPCCNSTRTCRDTKHIIISLRTEKVLRVIEAVRCYRGIRKKYKFYPSNDIILIHYYQSNRGVHYLRVLWKPENIDESKAIEAARKALELDYEEKVVIG